MDHEFGRYQPPRPRTWADAHDPLRDYERPVPQTPGRFALGMLIMIGSQVALLIACLVFVWLLAKV